LDAEVAKFHGVRSVYDALVGDSEPPHLYIYTPFCNGSFLDRSTTIIHEVSHLVGSIDAGHIGEFGFKPVYVAVETPEEVIYDTCAGFSPSGPIYPDGIGIDDYTRMSHADTFA
jgi:hypothetical protein